MSNRVGSPPVSIVVPVYNQEKLLPETFNSLFEQSFSDFEIIAVDDGSGDASLEVLKSFDDCRLQVITQDNCGQAAAINRGLESSTGGLIKIVDGDDVLNDTHLEAQVSALAERELEVASCRWTYFVDDVESAIPVDEATDRNYGEPFEWIVDTLSNSRGMFGAWQWLIPRELLDRVGLWNPSLSLEADFEFTVRLLLAADGIRFCPDAFLSYRTGMSASMSRIRNPAFLESAVRATELSTQRLIEFEDSPRIRRLCADRCQLWAYSSYPSRSDLTARSEQLAARFGGSSMRLPGGRINRILGMLLPWKVIRRLQEISYFLGWNRVVRAKEKARYEKLKRLAD